MQNGFFETVISQDADGFFRPMENSVYYMDCFELLSNLKENSIDLIATDPPYGINYNNFNWDKKDSLDWELLSLEFNRVLKKNGALVVFQGWSQVVETKKHLDRYFNLKNWIIYDRIKGRGTKKNLVSTREDILWYTKEADYVYNKEPSTIKKITGGTIGKKNNCDFRALSNVWTDISPLVPWSKERVEHPTQKPLFLMERIIRIFSNEGDVVLDPFMGSGTTMLASKKLKRKYIGSDISKEYYHITVKRLDG